MINANWKKSLKKYLIEIVPHAMKRSIERNFSIDKLRKLLFMGRWFDDPKNADKRYICICKDGEDYWTICFEVSHPVIFIITFIPSDNREKRAFDKKSDTL
ncbi:MAG: hypothetical protein HY051_00115 [Candidatus Aenigmarchaeota archaeon]|nr:hypothetical protein [Candidatus Aenigmarchaeota archaeon]